jgi:hypothetical protein
MLIDDLPKMSRVEVAINLLNQASRNLQEYDYPYAQMVVALAQQVLETLQLDFDLHFQAETTLEQMFNESLANESLAEELLD